MFSSKHAQGANGAGKKPTIRREMVLVPVKKQLGAHAVQKPAPTSAQRPTNRFQLSGSKKASTLPKKPQAPAQRAIAASRGVKRKSSSTPERVVFSSDEGSDSDKDDAKNSDASRKRIKSSVSSVESSGPRRNLVRESAFGKTPQHTTFLHGADATSGTQASKFNNAFYDEDFHTVELQYPSNSPRERFELKWPKNENEDYKPMSDITETIRVITSFYFPDKLRERYLSEETGWGRNFNRAWKRHSIPDFLGIVNEFNGVLKGLVEDGTIRRELAKKTHIQLDTVKRIMDQIYARTVSPKVETLRAYQNGSDNVYGELLSRFCSDIFPQVDINPERVFVDLGSGVGNVVLQAALEIGCQSWGIEMMPNPCDLAELQAKEFPGRTHLWGIDVGKINLVRGDLTKNSEIVSVLRRADIVLVNNQAFTPALNDTLLAMFLDLKTGARVVSLKPFVPEGHKITMRNISSVANLFVQQKLEYFSGCVSWTNKNGNYYIATKDPRPLEAFTKEAKAS